MLAVDLNIGFRSPSGYVLFIKLLTLYITALNGLLTLYSVFYVTTAVLASTLTLSRDIMCAPEIGSCAELKSAVGRKRKNERRFSF